MNRKITLLFLSWRDIKAPKMGGAEIYTHEMIKRVDKSKFNIIHFSPEFLNCKKEEVIDGITYLRQGSILSVISKAHNYYKKNKADIDFVVNQCNTHQFFTPFWVPKKKRIFFIHQLTREIWFYHASFPINIIGYLLEPLLLWINRKDKTIAVSESTKLGLIKNGFAKENISIIPEGLNFKPLEINVMQKKEEIPTFIYVGRFAKYKGIEDTIIAFSFVKKTLKDAKLWIVGKPDEDYIKKKLTPLCKKLNLIISENGDVQFKGFVTEEVKFELMGRAHLLIFPSRREGWGLTISEAAAVGTPSLVYDAPGTRDAVLNGEAGFMVNINNIGGLTNEMIGAISNKEVYEEIRNKSYEFSKTLHWDNTGSCFNLFCNNLMEEK